MSDISADVSRFAAERFDKKAEQIAARFRRLADDIEREAQRAGATTTGSKAPYTSATQSIIDHTTALLSNVGLSALLEHAAEADVYRAHSIGKSGAEL